MSEKETGGPAFPIPPVIIEKSSYFVPEGWGGDAGMTLRDHFAGQALIGIMANNDTSANAVAYARLAYQQADAMLTVRDEP